MSNDEETLSWADIVRELPTMGERGDGALLKLDYGIDRLWWRPDTNMLQRSSLGLAGWEDGPWSAPEDYPTPEKGGRRFPRSEVEAMPEVMAHYRIAIAHQILTGEEVEGLRDFRERLANEVLMSGDEDRP